MNKYIYFFIVNSLIIIGIIPLLLIIKLNCKCSNTIKDINNTPMEESLLIMSTNKEFTSSYVIFNLYNKTELKVFERKNNCYSDFVIDKLRKYLYYSNLVNGKYNIFKVDLDTKSETNLFNNNYYVGDIFDLYDETLVFRTISNDRRRFVIGKCSLTNNEIEILDNFNTDFDMFNFYIDKTKKIVYTIEYSLTEFENTNFPEMPTYYIFKYNIDTEQKELLYSTNRTITSISIDTNNRILFEAESIENNSVTKKIYLLNLNHQTEDILLQSNTNFKDINFENISKPKFTLDNKGFYFLATTDKSIIIEEVPGTLPIKSKAIYYYDLKFNNIKLVYDNKNEVINDYKIN